MGLGQSKQNLSLTCPACQERFSCRKALFLCPESRCGIRNQPPPDLPDACVGLPVFRPDRYAHSVLCPHSSHRAYRKFCPRCGGELRLPLGVNQSIGIVGSSESGKTMYLTALVRQICRRLAHPTALQMSLEWNEEDSRDHFTTLDRQIYREHQVPEATQLQAPLLSLSVTLRFTRRGWWPRLLGRTQGVISLICPDPSGEFFRDHHQIYGLSYLGQAQALLLMVDPLTTAPFRERRQDRMDVYADTIQSTAETLRVLIASLRQECGQQTGKLNKCLGLVLTKCDEEGVFNPDCPPHAGRFPVQGRHYNRVIARALGRLVADHLHRLELSELVALAEQNFAAVEFFAVSAVSRPPVRDPDSGVLRLTDPVPRRVEEPLLWVLHQWGYI
jgi:hypothetical protein